MVLNVVCFVIGAIFSGVVVKLYSEKKSQEELIKIRTQLETYKSLENLIKSDFSEIARETIKNEQADLRKQHQETLDLKLAPLAKELGEFKTKVENFNTTG